MPHHSISNRKLHCCLVILILFILIFLSLPLLLIYVANSRYEAHHSTIGPPTLASKPKPAGELEAAANASLRQHQVGGPDGANNNNNNNNFSLGLEIHSGPPFQLQPYESKINCTQYAMQANLSLIGDNFQCPEGTFPCQSCPDICIEQWRNCNGAADCPDRSDESHCHDSSGAIGVIFQNIVNSAARKNKSAGGLAAGPAGSLAKPDTCTFEQFVQEQCPCVFTDAHVIICDSLKLTSIPSTLLSSVYKIRMANNSISSLERVAWPRALSSLVLVNNRLSRLANHTFALAPNLSKLYLSHNEIARIELDAFAGLASLTSLQIESNRLETFDARALAHTPNIAKVYLSENQIELPEWTRFGRCESLKELLLDHNRIGRIRAHWFSNMSSLIWLSLTHNQISAIDEGSFNWDYELEELNLSFNRLKWINRPMFAKALNIQRLYLGGNPLEPLPVDAFREILQLKSLNLTSVHFDHIRPGTFAYLGQLEFIYFAKFRYCHHAVHVRVCRPLTDGLSSAEELLAFPVLKYAVWIVASVCSLGNVFVLVWRSVSGREEQTLSLFVRNLSLADLLMGVYLGAIGWQDWRFQHDFGRFAIEWMSSWQCTAIGFLAILSSELSVFILTIITWERHRSIMSREPLEGRAQRRRARRLVAAAWAASLLLAGYPLVGLRRGPADRYFATNGLCLPLHIDQPFTAGWQYSAFVYLGVNFAASMVILALYAHMYAAIVAARQAARPSALLGSDKREDVVLAVRFFFIVLTDCLCWLPIVVIKVMALASVPISSAIYGWLVVFIIPINSALNPIVYTLAAPTALRAALCRLAERLCHKLDALAWPAARGPGPLAAPLAWRAKHSSQSDSAASAHSEAQLVAAARRPPPPASSASDSCDTCDTSPGAPAALLLQQLRQPDEPARRLLVFAAAGPPAGRPGWAARPRRPADA